MTASVPHHINEHFLSPIGYLICGKCTTLIKLLNILKLDQHIISTLWWKDLYLLKHLSLDGAGLPVTARADEQSPYSLTSAKPFNVSASTA